MRSETEVRYANKRLRRHTQTAILFHFVKQSVMDESENGTHTLFVVCIYHAVCRLPLLNDEYTLPPPAGKESYCHSRMRSAYVLLRRRLKSLRCVPVQLFGQDAEDVRWHNSRVRRDVFFGVSLVRQAGPLQQVNRSLLRTTFTQNTTGCGFSLPSLTI